jgi:hypothetical protein
MGLKKCMTASLVLAMLSSSLALSSVSATTGNGLPIKGSVKGTGTVEGYVETDIMRVVLPTTDLNFLLDPEGVIKSTGAAAYAGKATFDYGGKDNGFVFFGKSEGGMINYSSSADLTFQNKSSFPVKVDVSAAFDSGESGIVLKNGTSGFAGSDPGICFDISDGQSTVNAASGGRLTKDRLSGSNDVYEYKYDKGKYSYEIKDSDSNTYPGYSVTLNGSCDSAASWGNVDPDKSKLSVTWYITKLENTITNTPFIENFSITADSKKLNDVVIRINYNNTDIKFDSLSFGTNGKAGKVAATNYSLNADSTVITIKAAALKSLKAGSYVYVVNFSNGSFDTVKLDMK